MAKFKLQSTAVGVALAFFASSGIALADDHGPTTTYKFGGYAKFDAKIRWLREVRRHVQ
jgi:hypothetical protein